MAQKRIFISKRILDMGRNRNIRKLEAQLDSQQGKKDVGTLSNPLSGVPRSESIQRQHFHERSAIDIADNHLVDTKTLGVNSELYTLLNPQEDYKIDFCNYEKICPLHKYSMKRIFGKDECRSKKFYDKYKNKLAPYERENPHHLWVGGCHLR